LTARRRTPSSRVAVALLALVPVLPVAGGCEEPEREPEPVTEPRSLAVESPFEYPVELWDSGVQGESVVMVHVTDAGAVDSVYLLERSSHAAFDSAAVTGAYELRFAPGRRGDERIAMWVRLPVRFELAAPGAGGWNERESEPARPAVRQCAGYRRAGRR
jgi:TonB family protein